MVAASTIRIVMCTNQPEDRADLAELLRARDANLAIVALPPELTPTELGADILVIDVASAPALGLELIGKLARARAERVTLALALPAQLDAVIAAGADDIITVDAPREALATRLILAERSVARSRAFAASADELARANANLTALIENTDDFILFSDRDGAPLIFNSAYAAVMKQMLDLDMAPGIKPHELVSDPAVRAEWDQYHRRVLSGEKFSTAYSHALDDGSVRYFEHFFNPVHRDGEIVGFSEYTRDVTENRVAEADLVAARNDLERKVSERTAELERSNLALQAEVVNRDLREEEHRKSEQRYRHVFDTAPLAFVVWGRDQRIQAWNPHAERIFGWSAEEAIGASIFELIIPDAAHADIQSIVDHLLEGEPSSHNINDNLTKSGDIITCEWNNALLFDRAGAVAGVLSLALDITDRVALEARLRQAEKLEALGQLAGGIAHDFNNQLVGIMGFADLLSRRITDDVGRSYASAIRQATQRSADLVAKLLAFARKGKQQSEPVDIHRIISDVVTLLKRSIDKRILIVEHLGAPATVIIGDPALLHSAILNLAINASDAMPDGGTVTLATKVVSVDDDDELSPGRYLRVTVTDTGTGIDAASLGHIFDPFFTTKEQGTGMGLATVYGVARNHHGLVRVHSDPAATTEFELLLPIAAAGAGAKPAPPDRIANKPAHVMVVDDERMVREVLASVLRELGHEVTTFGDGERALDYYRDSWRDIDLVIFDMVMPKLDGERLFAYLREVNPEVRALLSSGYALAGAKRSVAESGAVGFLQKPYDVDTVEAKVGAALAVRKGS